MLRRFLFTFLAVCCVFAALSSHAAERDLTAEVRDAERAFARTMADRDHAARPPRVLNLAGAEVLSVRRLAEELGRLLDRPVTFHGSEAADAFLSNAQVSHQLFGPATVPVAQMLAWNADWTRRGLALLGKPTKFQVRDGRF